MNNIDSHQKSSNFIIEKLKKYLSMNNKTLLHFFVIVGTSQTIYSVVALREVLYEPFRSVLGTSNAAFGTLFGLVGIVQIFGYLAFGWLQDKVNIRSLLTIDLLGYGICALIMSSIPNLPYSVLVIIFCLFGFFGDAIYWPTVQKSIKGVSHPDKQATVFGFMEARCGVSGIILNSLGIIIYAVLGNVLFGMRVAMSFNSLLMILFAFVVWKYIPNNFLKDTIQNSKKKNYFKTRQGKYTTFFEKSCCLVNWNKCIVYLCCIYWCHNLFCSILTKYLCFASCYGWNIWSY